MKHKHAELIKAWADGLQIEAFNPEHQKWIASSNPGWFPDIEYRIKPEKVRKHKIFRLEAHPLLGLRFQEHREEFSPDDQYIQVTFLDDKIESVGIIK